MKQENRLGEAKNQIASLFNLDHERVEALRNILEVEQKRKVSYSEANEVGHQLISLYECLAGDRQIIASSQAEHDETKQ